MRRILFNDKYGLTAAVLEGRKTMTRRLVPEYMQYDCANCSHIELSKYDLLVDFGNGVQNRCLLPYRVGDIVAVAQPYKDVSNTNHFIETCLADEWRIDYRDAGWNNKMFVKACLMPNKIRITDIKIERLQDISDEDCLKEGVVRREIKPFNSIEIFYQVPRTTILKPSPRESFASLIDKVSGKGTWGRNPFVFAYSFELIR